jgi:molecular chaperone GrpE (heat shock protein)
MRNYEQETVIPFAPAAKSAGSNDADQLDTAGRTILSLLNKAASVADENSQHALDMAQKLSHQLRAAENRITELEADVRYYQDRCERADQWLHKIFSEIEERFLKPDDKRRAGVLPGRPVERRA